MSTQNTSDLNSSIPYPPPFFPLATWTFQQVVITISHPVAMRTLRGRSVGDSRFTLTLLSCLV